MKISAATQLMHPVKEGVTGKQKDKPDVVSMKRKTEKQHEVKSLT